MIEFADIAYPYQDGADITAYARAGADRILIKATEGTGYTNPLFGAWSVTAGVAYLGRGAYHYAELPTAAGLTRAAGGDNRRMGDGLRAAALSLTVPVVAERLTTAALLNAQMQADLLCTTLDAASRPWGARDWVELDLEDPDGIGVAAVWAAEFCGRMAAHGYPGLIYTGSYYLAATGLTPGMLPPEWRRLHLANYSAVGDTDLPIPPGWTPDQVVARQYTDAAPTPGLGACDRSRVLREWLPEEDDMPSPSQWTDADWKAFATHMSTPLAQAVYDRLSWDAFVDAPGTGDPTDPRPNQPNLGRVWRATYNKLGALQDAVAALLPKDHPLAARLANPAAPAPAAADPTLES